MTSLICEAVESTLSSSNTSRTLTTLKAPLATPNATMPGFIPRPNQTQTSVCVDAADHGHSGLDLRAKHLVLLPTLVLSLTYFLPAYATIHC